METSAPTIYSDDDDNWMDRLDDNIEKWNGGLILVIVVFFIAIIISTIVCCCCSYKNERRNVPDTVQSIILPVPDIQIVYGEQCV